MVNVRRGGPFRCGEGRGGRGRGEIRCRSCLNTKASSRDSEFGAARSGPGEREMNNVEPLIWQACGGYGIRPPFTEQLNHPARAPHLKECCAAVSPLAGELGRHGKHCRRSPTPQDQLADVSRRRYGSDIEESRGLGPDPRRERGRFRERDPKNQIGGQITGAINLNSEKEKSLFARWKMGITTPKNKSLSSPYASRAPIRDTILAFR